MYMLFISHIFKLQKIIHLKGLQVTVHEDTVDSLYAQRTLSTNLLFWIKP